MTGPAKTIAVDFDGVLHSYASGWQGDGTVADPPVDGAVAWLNEITDWYDVAINSVRSGTVKGRVGMRNWLVQNGVSEKAMDRIRMEPGKPRAVVYVDDRAWRFEGDNFPTPNDIEGSDPWWRR